MARRAESSRQDDPAPCPACGQPIPPRTGPGRPARWCSKTCRQAVHRARQAAERSATAARELSDWIAGTGYLQVQDAGRALDELVLAMCEDGDDVDPDVALRTGHRWEPDVAAAARALATAALRLAETADAHAREAAAYRQAHAQLPAEVLNEPDSVAAAAAAVEATQSNAFGEDQAEAVDELFDAVEDVIAAHITGTLPPGLAPLTKVLNELEATFQDATGDAPGPLLQVAGDLVSRFPSKTLLASAPTCIQRLARAVTAAHRVLPDSVAWPARRSVAAAAPASP